jgi:arylsulfatase A-like enzyme
MGSRRLRLSVKRLHGPMKRHPRFSPILMTAFVIGQVGLLSARAADPPTPNLERLISQSVLFRNAHCAAPVCSASRHALLSGLRPSTTGWYSNSSKSKKRYEEALGETVPLPTHFKHNGYRKRYHRRHHDSSPFSPSNVLDWKRTQALLSDYSLTKGRPE